MDVDEGVAARRTDRAPMPAPDLRIVSREVPSMRHVGMASPCIFPKTAVEE